MSEILVSSAPSRAQQRRRTAAVVLWVAVALALVTAAIAYALLRLNIDAPARVGAVSVGAGVGLAEPQRVGDVTASVYSVATSTAAASAGGGAGSTVVSISAVNYLPTEAVPAETVDAYLFVDGEQYRGVLCDPAKRESTSGGWYVFYDYCFPVVVGETAEVALVDGHVARGWDVRTRASV